MFVFFFFRKSDLDSLKISLEGGQTNLNFAEAALLIQVYNDCNSNSNNSNSNNYVIIMNGNNG